MASTGLKSYRFPAGLRVLVVDTPAWLKILEKMLIKCKYQVTMCNLAQEALDLIETKKDGFDIVMSDANVADMDDEFVERVHRLQKNLPVIMMCVEDGETSDRVMKGVKIGACDYLLKPIRVKVVRNIWQHVVRAKIHDLTTVEAKQSLEQILNSDAASLGEKKRKPNESAPPHPSSINKRPRVVWIPPLHSKFVEALDRIGLEKAGPKKILDLMGEPTLTRENVASHLQKYRIYLLKEQKENELKKSLYLKKQKENELKSFYGGMNLSQNGVNPNSLSLQQNSVINRNYVAPGIHERGNVSGAMPLPQPQAMLQQQGQGDNIPVFGDSAGNHPMSYNHQQQFQLKDVAAVKSESTRPSHYTWNGGAPPSHFMPHFQSSPHPYDHFPLVSHNPAHLYSMNRSSAIGAESTTAFPSNPQHSPLAPCHTFDPVEQYLHNDLKSSYKNFGLGTGSAEAAAEIKGYSSAPDDTYLQHPFANLEPLGCINQENLLADAQPDVYDPQDFADGYGSNQWPVM